MSPILIIVGGFLGAGKTTALIAAAQRLAARGMRVGVITNDQSGDLVDAALVESYRLDGAAVEGGCFCCRLDDMISTTDRLLVTLRPDVLLAEPVGSCTDLVATVVRPLERHYGEGIQIAPFSVLVDPTTLADRLPDSHIFPSDVNYLFERQLREADLVVLTRADVIGDEQRAWAIEALHELRPEVPIHTVSSLRGDGIDEWLDSVLLPAEGSRASLELDYDRYADAEAALAWLNAGLLLSAALPFNPDTWIEHVLAGLQTRLNVADARIAHLKAQVRTTEGASKASIVHRSTITFDRNAPSTTRSAFALINARAVCSPEHLEGTLRAALAAAEEALGVSATFTSLQSFAPARPVPQQRILVS